MTQPSLSVPVATLERIRFGASSSQVADILVRDGGVVLTQAVTTAEVTAINHELDDPFNAIDGGNFSDGDKTFIGDFMGKRTRRLAHCVKFSPTLRTFYANSHIPEYLAATMPGPVGSHTMYSSQGIEILPGEKAQVLHRDGGELANIFGVSGPNGANLQVNFLLALTDFTEEMGATRVIPGSNQWSDYKETGHHEQTIPAIMNPGDVLLINGKVLHGGGANITRDRVRRVISTAFSPGIILGEEAWPHVISVEEARQYPKQVQAFLGFRSISYRGEQPGFLWRAHTRPLEEFLSL